MDASHPVLPGVGSLPGGKPVVTRLELVLQRSNGEFLKQGRNRGIFKDSQKNEGGRPKEQKYLQYIQTIKAMMDEKHTSWIKEAHSTSANTSL